jgi:hypothetical protein
MGFSCCYLIVDAPLKGTAEEALAMLGFDDLQPLDEEMDIGDAGQSLTADLGVAEYDGCTIFAGDAMDVALDGGEEVRSLVAGLGARRAVGIFLESMTDSVGYAIVEEGHPTATRFDSRDGGLPADDVRAMWKQLHRWEVEYLGTANPERDEDGRPLRVTEDGEREASWMWAREFAFELPRYILGMRLDTGDWHLQPARCFRVPKKRPRRPVSAPVPKARRRGRVSAPARTAGPRVKDYRGAIRWGVALVVVALLLALRACGAF